MLICKNPRGDGDWSCDGYLIWCSWCMQRSNPNDFQMMEETSCVHLSLPKNLACIYQMLQSVERTGGKWQHIISFQWICVLPADYYWVSLNTCRFFTFIFLSCRLSNNPPQTYITYAGTDQSLIRFLLLECCRMALRWRKDPRGRETLCSRSYYTCCRSGHALINGEESWGEKGKMPCGLLSLPCPVKQIFNIKTSYGCALSCKRPLERFVLILIYEIYWCFLFLFHDKSLICL